MGKFLIGLGVGTMGLGLAWKFLSRRPSQPVAVVTPTGAITGGLVALPAHFYVGESFVPYQMSDGTWVSSQASVDQWLAAHPGSRW